MPFLPDDRAGPSTSASSDIVSETGRHGKQLAALDLYRYMHFPDALRQPGPCRQDTKNNAFLSQSRNARKDSCRELRSSG